MRAVITFHSVDDANDVLSFSPELFAYLLNTLKSSGIPILSLDNLLNTDTQRGVALTFDDGMKSVWSNALPVMRRFDAVACVYISTDLIGQQALWPREEGVGQYKMMNWDNVLDLHEAGCKIEAHTQTHPDLRLLSDDQINQQCDKSDQLICRYTGRQPAHFAYPFGYHNQMVRNVIGKRYQSAVTTEVAYLGKEHDRAAIPRIDSYYLRSKWMIDNLDSAVVRLYLRARSLSRTLAGTQCPAKCN